MTTPKTETIEPQIDIKDLEPVKDVKGGEECQTITITHSDGSKKSYESCRPTPPPAPSK